MSDPYANIDEALKATAQFLRSNGKTFEGVMADKRVDLFKGKPRGFKVYERRVEKKSIHTQMSVVCMLV